MEKKVNWERFIRAITLLFFVTVLISPFFQSCQKDEIFETEDVMLKSAVAPEIYLNYPETDVVSGEDFDITYSSSCGKIMLERGFVEEYDEITFTSNKVYVGLTFETENLQWESVGEDVFETCEGDTFTESKEEPGTYVYRVKLNMKAVKNSGCPDCETFVGNQFEYFMITVIECTQNTFTDERDGHVYKTVTIGNQTWMAENLVYETETGSYAYGNNENNVATYGRLYTWDAAHTACPAGWHIATNDEWTTLVNYLIDNNYGYEGSGEAIAKALASTTGWEYISFPGFPGNDPASNNSSGFNALPAGELVGTDFYDLGRIAYWWTGSETSTYVGIYKTMSYNYHRIGQSATYKMYAFSVRCIKD